MNASLRDWLKAPDFDLFTNYEKFMISNPKADVHLIDPRSLWNLWKVLQDFANIPIVKNIPSSGFIGIAILLPVCSELDIVEYIPSTRLNGRCHYYSEEVTIPETFHSYIKNFAFFSDQPTMHFWSLASLSNREIVCSQHELRR